MPVHTIRIESTADQNVVELQSAATWARGPGRTLSFRADGTGGDGARLEIDDRVVRFGRAAAGAGTAAGPMTLVVQVATADDRLTLLTEKAGAGALTVSSDCDTRANDRQGGAAMTARLVLFLTPDAGHAPSPGASSTGINRTEHLT
jgi:hypothetical protein